jgi:hypothetical protein
MTRPARVLHSGPPFGGPSPGVPLGSSCRRIDVVTCVFTPTPLPVDRGCPDQQGDNRDQEEQQVDHREPPGEACSGVRRSRRACLLANRRKLFNEAQVAMEPGWLQRLAGLPAARDQLSPRYSIMMRPPHSASARNSARPAALMATRMTALHQTRAACRGSHPPKRSPSVANKWVAATRVTGRCGRPLWSFA